MDTQRNTAVAEQSQEASRHEAPPLDLLVADLRHFRDTSLPRERRRRAAVLAGQLLILALQYRTGRPPNRRTLKRFFYFVAQEQVGPIGGAA